MGIGHRPAAAWWGPFALLFENLRVDHSSRSCQKEGCLRCFAFDFLGFSWPKSSLTISEVFQEPLSSCRQEGPDFLLRQGFTPDLQGTGKCHRGCAHACGDRVLHCLGVLHHSSYLVGYVHLAFIAITSEAQDKQMGELEVVAAPGQTSRWLLNK